MVVTKGEALDRSALVEAVIRKLATSDECISLSAPNNFGKSSLLRRLLQVYQADPTSFSPVPLKIVYVDCNLRADDTAQAFYELILRSLTSLENQFLTDPVLGPPAGAASFYERVSQSQSAFEIAHSFLAALESRLDTLKLVRGKLILLLDEFDAPLSSLPPAVLRQLRALKDRFPTQLIYLTATKFPILYFDRQGEAVEEDQTEFFELFETYSVLRLAGLNQNETNALAEAEVGNLAPEALTYTYKASGGHPALTRLVSRLVKSLPDLDEGWENLADYLIQTDTAIRLECRRLWQSLAGEEQTALLQSLQGIQSANGTLEGATLGSLVERGLQIAPLSVASDLLAPDQLTTGQPPRIFARVFEWFVSEQLATLSQARSASYPQTTPKPSSPNPSFSTSNIQDTDTLATNSVVTSGGASRNGLELAYDPRHEIIIFDSDGGQRRLPLSGNMAVLFKYLWQRQSIPYCTKDELLTAVWGQNTPYGAENLDRLVSDLRQLVGDHDKQIIRTIHRRGLQMVNVAEWNA